MSFIISSFIIITIIIIIIDDHNACRFLVLCQYKMPGTFTVKAGFNMPTSQSSPSSPSGSLQPVDISESEGTSRESREFSEQHRVPPRIITAQSLDSARLSKILAGTSHSASQRNSRTLANNLFGGRQLGEEAGAEDNNHKMWMIVLTVSAGLVVISVMAVLVVCRPASSQQDEELAEMSPACSQVNVNHGDTEALQPKKKEKKVYRPSESRA